MQFKVGDRVKCVRVILGLAIAVGKEYIVKAYCQGFYDNGQSDGI